MKKVYFIICVIFCFILTSCNLKKDIISNAKEIIEQDSSDEISIYSCVYNRENQMAYVKFHSDNNGNDEALIDFENNKIYYESVYSSINENDYDKIIEYGDYATNIYQIQSSSEDWKEIEISKWYKQNQNQRHMSVGDSIEKVTDTFNNEYKMSDNNYCVLFNESQEDPMNEQKDDSWIWINYLTENDTIVRIQIYNVKFGANLN